MIKIGWLGKKIWKKREKWIGIRNGFLVFSQGFIVHTLVIKYDQLGIFEHDKSYFSYHACIHHIRHQVKYLMLNLFQRLRNMGDWWEARNSAIENFQEEFGHDIWEMRKELVRLTNLFENNIKTVAAHPRDPTPLSNQQALRPFV